jgi:hypothetical protein
MNWLQQILKLIQRKSSPHGGMEISPAQAAKMIEMIQKTQENELACDEVHGLLDQFAEIELRGEDAAALLPLVQHHLELCPDCQEEHDALLRVLQAQTE